MRPSAPSVSGSVGSKGTGLASGFGCSAGRSAFSPFSARSRRPPRREERSLFSGFSVFSVFSAFAGASAGSAASGSAVSSAFTGASALGAGFSVLGASSLRGASLLRAGLVFCAFRESVGISKSSSGSSSFTVRRTLASRPNMPNRPGLPASSISMVTSARSQPSSFRPALMASSVFLPVFSIDLIWFLPPQRAFSLRRNGR